MVCCSVAKSYLTLGDPTDCSIPGFPVLHQLLEFAQTQVHLVQWCHPAILSSVFPFSCPQSFPASVSFPVSRLFASSGQSTGASASASVLPRNIQGWFPLGLTGLISLLSKELSKVFPAPQFESISSSALSLRYGPTLTFVHEYRKDHSFGCTDLCSESVG